MPTFDTPRPITATLELSVASVHVDATDRTDTTVEVTPTDPGKRDDVLAAERTRLDHAEGHLDVRTPHTWRRYSWSRDGGSIDVRIHCPTGSDLVIAGQVVAVRATGVLGQARVSTSVGELRVEHAATVALRAAGMGEVTVGRVEQDAEIGTGSGEVRVTAVGGDVQVKNSNGDTWIGDAGGTVGVKAANGDIVLDHAAAGVTAKTANGDVRLGHVGRGEIVAESGCGRVDIGIAPGVAAWLDLHTSLGHVHNHLDTTAPPVPGEDTVRVRARSAAGDITIRHAGHAADLSAAGVTGNTEVSR